MKRGRWICSVMLMVLIALILSSCTETVEEVPSDTKATEATAEAMSEAFRQIGMPNIVNFQQKKLMKMIFELCDKEDLICHAYLFNAFKGEVGEYLGECIGFGIPFSAQYTNPERVAHRKIHQGGSFGTLPQPDPNGLFMPTSSSATWLIMVDPETKKLRPIYVEPEIIVSPFPLHK